MFPHFHGLPVTLLVSRVSAAHEPRPCVRLNFEERAKVGDDMSVIMNIIFGMLNIIMNILLFFLVMAFSLRFFYAILGLFPLKKFPAAKKNHKYKILIAARNEEKVIAQLIDSIKKQDYPKELFDVFVVADNCTDRTAEVARQAGAVVYERLNKEKRGKGYALDFLINEIFEHHPDDCKGFLVFDADNLLKRNYLHEMNKAVDSGLRMVTSYRNTKNFDVNWITSAYGVCFLQECRFAHKSRQRLGTSTLITGTGFYVDAEIFRLEKGWKYHIMTEDLEFTIAQVLKNEKVGYAEDAEFYDEQPQTFVQSYKQRSRWMKGSYQAFWRYGRRLLAAGFRKHGYAKLDLLLLYVVPVPFALSTCLFLNALLHLVYDVSVAGVNTDWLILALKVTASFLARGYVPTFLISAWVIFLERKHINMDLGNKVKYAFLVPIFMLTYLPIFITAMFFKVTWAPIKRNSTINIVQLEDAQKSAVNEPQVAFLLMDEPAPQVHAAARGTVSPSM